MTSKEERAHIGITTRKSEDFSEWYTKVILKSGLADYSPASGFMVIRPRGYALWEKIRSFFDTHIKRMGVENAYFPLVIPERLLKREMDHFEGFVPEVAWVTMTGDTELSERLAIRPTSETIMYNSYAKWISSYKDLPLKINLWNSVVRMEFGDPKLFLRTREFLWQEGHSCFGTKAEAEEEVLEILDLYRRVAEDLLAIPVITGKKSRLEKFAGADYTMTLEALMPDLKALQMGTSHHLARNFSEVFDILFTDTDGERKFVYQNSWGMSTRLIGAMVMVHGDDRGLVVPPRVAEPEVVIVPIYYGEDEESRVDEECKGIVQDLTEADVSVTYDDRQDYTPGWKFNDWELKGVPIRIEVGPRDLEKGQAVLVRRDTYEKTAVEREELTESVSSALERIQENLYQRAKTLLDAHITDAEDFGNFRNALRDPGGFVRACWCGRDECETAIKDKTGASSRLLAEEEDVFSPCVHCGEDAQHVAYFSRAY